jgi:hypothetical protein
MSFAIVVKENCRCPSTTQYELSYQELGSLNELI